MAYKGKEVGPVASVSHLVDEIKSFLMSCGWIDQTPTNQDDPNGFILGHFLQSSGENGTADHLIHIGLVKSFTSRSFVEVSYLSSGITDTDTTIPITYTTGIPTAGVVRVDDEIITYTGLSGGSLTGCSRGHGLSTAASHSKNAVIQWLSDSSTWWAKIAIEIAAFRDLSNAIASSDLTKTWNIDIDSVSGVSGLDGYGNNRFDYHTLLRVNDTGSSENGKMRWVKTYADTGDFTYQPFLTAPGAVSCDVVSSGFLPGLTWRAATGESNFYRPLTDATPPSGIRAFLYGSRDGYMAVYMYGSEYYPYYVGSTYGHANLTNANTTAALSAGDSVIHVDNTDIFEINAKYRIISQDMRDWDDNKDRQVGDGWPPLDPEEIPTEEFVVSAIDSGAGTITLSSNLIYSYRTGAVVGEDPRPIVRAAEEDGKSVISAGTYYAPCYLPCDPSVISAHASHRQTWRAHHASGNPKAPRNSSFYSCLLYTNSSTSEGILTNSGVLTVNRQNGHHIPILVNLRCNNESTSYGYFKCWKGILPQIWRSYASPPFSGSEEDIIRALWEGKFEDFRLFKDTANVWFFVGPEIT